MSRIRSVHPGFFKDERLVPCSAFARLLFIGIGVEADDKGIFEWKPLTLKMTVFPGDNVVVEDLLEELLSADAIMRFEVDGKAYGAIRNFRKYQRPKTPNDIYPMPDFVAEYVAFPQKAETPKAEPAPFPPKGEKSPQMEDGGGRMKDEAKTPPPVIVADGARELFGEVWSSFPRNPASIQAMAWGEFQRLGPDDQAKLPAAASRYQRFFVAECKERDRTQEAGLRFVPYLSTWISSGAWREAGDLPVKGESSGPPVPMTKLDRERDRDLWRACEAQMGKKAPTDGTTWYFLDEVIAKAKASTAQAA